MPPRRAHARAEFVGHVGHRRRRAVPARPILTRFLGQWERLMKLHRDLMQDVGPEVLLHVLEQRCLPLLLWHVSPTSGTTTMVLSLKKYFLLKESSCGCLSLFSLPHPSRRFASLWMGIVIGGRERVSVSGLCRSGPQRWPVQWALCRSHVHIRRERVRPIHR